MAIILGIDLGTTNSVAAMMEGTRTQVLENKEGDYTTPSVVSITPDSPRPIVGQIAKEQAMLNPLNTIYSVKRIMGRRFDDPEVKDAAEHLPYKIVAGDAGIACVEIEGKQYPPQHISGLVLQKLKEDSEAKLGESITQAIITVPAYFNDSQRRATVDAGTIAGLEVLRIVTEPVAGALAWGIDRHEGDATVAVIDLGGGTFDVTILEVGDGVFEAKSINGDTYLGGHDFDIVIQDWLVEEFKGKTSVDLKQQDNRNALQLLNQAAEQAKIRLTTTVETLITQGYIAFDSNGPLHLSETLTRAKFEEMTKHLVDRLERPCQGAMADAGVAPGDIDEVILVGGMTRMPAVREKVKEIFGREPTSPVNPDEAVAIGAALQAGIIGGEPGMAEVLLIDVTPLSLGQSLEGDINQTVIPRGTSIPATKTVATQTVRDNQTSADANVVQGESPVASQNHQLGRYRLEGLPPAPAGHIKFEDTFTIDANGILTVTCRETSTGNAVTVTIEGSCRLPESEIERMTDEVGKSG